MAVGKGKVVNGDQLSSRKGLNDALHERAKLSFTGHPAVVARPSSSERFMDCDLLDEFSQVSMALQ